MFKRIETAPAPGYTTEELANSHQSAGYCGWVIPCLVLVVLASSFPRALSARSLGGRLLLENDAYRFVRQAALILHHGRLPAVDHYRWFPEGADLHRWPTFYPYVLAGATKVLHGVDGRITLHQVAVYYPVVAWALTLVFVYAFCALIWNPCSGLIAVVALAFWPVTLQRTSAGFADMDALGLLLCVFFFYSAARVFRAGGRGPYTLWMALAAFSLAAVVLSWAGAGLLLLAIALWVILARISGSLPAASARAILAILISSLVICLAIDPFYFIPPSPWTGLTLTGFGIGIVFALVPPRVQSLVLQNLKVRPGGRYLRWTLFAVASSALALLISRCLSQDHINRAIAIVYQNAVAPLGNGSLMRNVSELRRMGPEEWIISLNLLLPFMVWGLAYAGERFGRSLKYPPNTGWTLVGSLFALGILTTTPTVPGGSRIGPWDSYFCVTGVVALAGAIALAGRSSLCERSPMIEEPIESMFEGFLIIWFMVSFVAARGAVRYVANWAVFAGLLSASAVGLFLERRLGRSQSTNFAVALASIATIWYLRGLGIGPVGFLYGKWVHNSTAGIAACLAISLLIFAFFGLGTACSITRASKAVLLASLCTVAIWASLMGHQSAALAASVAAPLTELGPACDWLARTDPGAVVFANWDYGSILNVLADARTVIDENHQYGLNRIYDAAQTVFCATDPSVALAWLRGHRVRYFLLTATDASNVPRMLALNGNSPKAFVVSWIDQPVRLASFGKAGACYLSQLPKPYMFPKWIVAEKARKLDPSPTSALGLLATASTLDRKRASIGAPIGLSVLCASWRTGDFVCAPVSANFAGVTTANFGSRLKISAALEPWNPTNQQWLSVVASNTVARTLTYRLFNLNEKIPGFRLVFDSGPADFLHRVRIWRVD